MSEPLIGAGCDFFPDGTWKDCCDIHDVDFGSAGDLASFLHANQDLATCVANNGGGWVIAGVMFIGVMVGGFFVYPFKRFGGKSLFQIVTGKKY